MDEINEFFLGRGLSIVEIASRELVGMVLLINDMDSPRLSTIATV